MPKTPRRKRANMSVGTGSGVDLARVALSLAVSLLAPVMVSACNRQIEDPTPEHEDVPEHRFETCRTWCAMIFDPNCPQEVEVESETKCIDGCVLEDGLWGRTDDGHDACAETHIPYVECMASLACEERNQHFALANVVPTEERSSCGPLLRPRLDCQLEHY